MLLSLKSQVLDFLILLLTSMRTILSLGLITIAFTLFSQPTATPASGYHWVLVSTGFYSSGEFSTTPGAPGDTSFGLSGDSDPTSCSGSCGGNCDGEAYIQDRVFGSTPGFNSSSCEQRAVTLTQWNNLFPDSGVSNGATSGTVYLPTSASVNIIPAPNPGDSGTGAGGDENRFWVIGGDSGPQSNFNISVDYDISWQIVDFSLSGSSGNENFNFTVTYNDAGSGNEYETSGWNNYTTAGFGNTFSEVLPVSTSDLSQTGGTFEVIFDSNSSITVTRNWGNADAKAQHGPGMEGRASHVVNYQVWEIQEILPVELIDFRGRAMNDEIKLTWTTASETNNEKFIVQKLIDNAWISISEIRGSGNSLRLIDYKYVDEFPLAGINYYRLVQNDYDGTSSVSPVVDVYFKNSNLVIKPNPVNDYLKLFTEKSISTMAIFDQLGQCMMQKQEDTNRLNIAELQRGIYYIQVKYADGSLEIKKFVKI